MNLEQHKLLEYREPGATTSFYRKPIKSEIYYLLEIGNRDGIIKIIDISQFKKDLEHKAEEYNELALEDKEYWKLNSVAHQYEVKTIEKGFYDKEETTDNSRSQN